VRFTPEDARGEAREHERLAPDTRPFARAQVPPHLFDELRSVEVLPHAAALTPRILERSGLRSISFDDDERVAQHACRIAAHVGRVAPIGRHHATVIAGGMFPSEAQIQVVIGRCVEAAAESSSAAHERRAHRALTQPRVRRQPEKSLASQRHRGKLEVRRQKPEVEVRSRKPEVKSRQKSKSQKISLLASVFELLTSD